MSEEERHTELRVLKKLTELKSELHYYQLMYHVFKEPVVSDQLYDITSGRYSKLCSENRFLVSMVPRCRTIREMIESHGKKSRHDFPMLELPIVYDIQGLSRWFDKVESEEILIEPNLEGVDVELIYQGGHLHKAVTKGDGLEGRDITMDIHLIARIPATISENERVVVQGRVVLSHLDLGDIGFKPDDVVQAATHLLNNNFTRATHSRLSNPDLNFFPTYVHVPGQAMSLLDARTIACNWGFSANPCWVLNGRVREFGALEEGVDAFVEKQLKDYIYKYDGFRFSVNESVRRCELGYTSRFPEWAVKLERKKSNVQAISSGSEGAHSGTGN